MAIIMAEGLFNGKRLRACSDMARLLWPYLFLASNGYGRLEIDYEYIIRNFFVDFRNPPKSSAFFGILREYHENGLMFLYESGGVWGQWDCKGGSLPRYQTAKDRKSPAPDEKSFEEWKKQCSLKTKALPIISEIFGKLPLGVGIGEGVGDGKGVCAPATPKPTKNGFTHPTAEEVLAYGKSIDFEIDAEKFIAHYGASGWKRGKQQTPITNWKQCVQTWRANQRSTPTPQLFRQAVEDSWNTPD